MAMTLRHLWIKSTDPSTKLPGTNKKSIMAVQPNPLDAIIESAGKDPDSICCAIAASDDFKQIIVSATRASNELE